MELQISMNPLPREPVLRYLKMGAGPPRIRMKPSSISLISSMKLRKFLEFWSNVMEIWIQESYNTPREHTPGNPLANCERNPLVACW